MDAIDGDLRTHWSNMDSNGPRASKLLRNIMAGVAENQSEAISRGLDGVLLEKLPSLDDSLKSIAVQTLANMILGNTELQNSKWKLWMETGVFTGLLKCDNVGDTVLMVLVNLIHFNPEICKCIMETDSGKQLLLQIYTPGDHVTAQNSRYELVYLFTKHLVNQVDLKQLMNRLERNGSSIEQVDFLKFVDAGVQDNSTKSLHQLFELFNQYSERVTDLMLGLRQEVEEYDFVILTILLQILSRISENLTVQQKHELATETDALGWLVVLLKDLHAHRPRLRASAATNPLTKTPEQQKNPFYLLKSDVVQVLGNLAYESTTVQNQVRERDGIGMILEMCTLDPENPCMYSSCCELTIIVIRERALFTLRNLLTNSPDNQQLVKAMEPQNVVSDEYLDEMGVNVQIDQEGKLKFTGK